MSNYDMDEAREKIGIFFNMNYEEEDEMDKYPLD